MRLRIRGVIRPVLPEFRFRKDFSDRFHFQLRVLYAAGKIRCATAQHHSVVIGEIAVWTSPNSTEEFHPRLLEGIRSTYDGPLSVANDTMVWNTKDTVVERMAASTDRV